MSSRNDIIDRLYAVIQERKAEDPQNSYVASLFHKGNRKIAEKVGEEAVETVVAAVARSKNAVIAESADLLFHLMVLWAANEISPDRIREELVRREGISGHDAKRRRRRRTLR